MQYYINKNRHVDFLIIEINENSLSNKYYDNVKFDYKVLVNFETTFNLHMENDDYNSLKSNFMKREGVNIINKSSDIFDLCATENCITFNDSYVDENCDVNLIETNIKLNDSSCTMRIGEDIVNIKSNINTALYKNLTVVTSILYAIDMLDFDSFFNDFVINELKLEGRYQIETINNKTVIVDSGNCKSLQTFMNETNDVSNYNVKGLISIAGGMSDVLYNTMVNSGFKSLNKYVVADPIVRKHCLTFGGNLYKACHKLAVFRDDDAFNEVVNEVGVESFLNLSNNTLSLPENIVEEMIDVCIMLGTDDLTRNPKYCKNFWWRSIPTIKGYFTINYDKFIQVYNVLKSLDNDTLSESCDYVKQMIDYTISQYSQFGKSLENLPIQKIYITLNTINEWKSKLELEMYKAFFTQEVEIFEDREKALEQMSKEAKENDVLFIAGRGDRTLYINNIGQSHFTDMEYITSLLNKEDDYYVEVTDDRRE